MEGDARAEAREAARRIERLASSYGPHGAMAVAGDRLAKGAAVLRETLPGPALVPYTDLATSVHRHAGDGATTAVLLAARLVRRALEGDRRAATHLDGYRLARRQALASIDAQRTQAPPGRVLAHVSSVDAGIVLDGLRRLAAGGRLDLDAVDVRVEPGAVPAWSDGLLVPARAAPPARTVAEGGVLVCREVLRLKPRHEAAGAGGRVVWSRAEREARTRLVAHLRGLGVTVVVTPAGVDEDTADALGAAGVLVVADAARHLVVRVAAATGATAVHDAATADGSCLGRGSARRDRHKWTVTGRGPSATLLLDGHTPIVAAHVQHDAERLLRAAGLVLASPGGVPGGGRWQRAVAASLRSAADHAPGRAPLSMRAAAQCFDGLADDLVRNGGGDPLGVGLPPGAHDVLDPAAAVRLAVDGAFQCALSILRLDARHTKRPSTPARLRGPGRVGSPKGMPGDVPPLM